MFLERSYRKFPVSTGRGLYRVISQVCDRLKGDAPFNGLAEESATRFERRVP